MAVLFVFGRVILIDAVGPVRVTIWAQKRMNISFWTRNGGNEGCQEIFHFSSNIAGIFDLDKKRILKIPPYGGKVIKAFFYSATHL